MQVNFHAGRNSLIAIGILAVPVPASKRFPKTGPKAAALIAKAALTSVKSIESYSIGVLRVQRAKFDLISILSAFIRVNPPTSAVKNFDRLLPRSHLEYHNNCILSNSPKFPLQFLNNKMRFFHQNLYLLHLSSSFI